MLAEPLSSACQAALRTIVAGRDEIALGFAMILKGATPEAIAELSEGPAALIVEWPGLRSAHYTLTPLGAERLGVELDELGHWCLSPADPELPELADLIYVLGGLKLPAPEQCQIPGDRLVRGVKFDRLPWPERQPEPEPVRYLLDHLGEPYLIQGQPVPLKWCKLDAEGNPLWVLNRPVLIDPRLGRAG